MVNISEDLLVGAIMAMSVTISIAVIAFFGVQGKAISEFMGVTAIVLTAMLAILGVATYGILSKWGNNSVKSTTS